MKRLLSWCSLLAMLLTASPLFAQGLSPRPGGRQPGRKAVDKPAGPAEAAPQDDSDEPELPPAPTWPGQEGKKLQFFQMKGYFRFRGDIMHNLNLGLPDRQNAAAPYWVPVSENTKSKYSCSKRVNKPVPGGSDRGIEADDCPDNTLTGANIRLRLEPTINVAEKVQIHTQIDVFDNLVMGSTPNGGFLDGTRAPHIPLIAFADTQQPPIVGRNASRPSILVKRAWAEVLTPLGMLKFGRMPSHWGLGLLANNGSCLDCDYGDNADRVMFATKLAGHVVAMGYDFAANGPSTLTVASAKPYFDGPVIDIEQLDDVDQLFWVVGRIDKPDVIKDRVEPGELELNYGTYVVWRKQDFDYASGTGLSATPETYANSLVERHAWAVIPDLWFKLYYKKLYVEFEGVMIGGKIENSGDDATVTPLSILQFGWVMRGRYKLLRDALKVGLEVGMASGDDVDPSRNDLNRRRTLTPQFETNNRFNDNSVNEFKFDYDYHVDLILFRELLGTVANAIYFKPSIQYDLLESFGARLDVIYSLAHRPVATPGNSAQLGLEFDLDVYYRNEQEGFYAGVQYGLLVPFAALDRPREIFESAAADAEVAQTLQARLVVKF